MFVPVAVLVAALTAFFAGRSSAEAPPAGAAKKRPHEQPRRPRTLARALVEQHPRLEHGVRHKLVGPTAGEAMQALQPDAQRVLEQRLATTSLHTCALDDERDARLFRLGPLGKSSALDAIRAAQEMGGEVYVTLGAAFELIGGTPPSAIALLAFAEVGKPPALARMREFARLGAIPPPTSVSRAQAPPPATNGAHKPATDPAAPPTSSTGAADA